MKIARIELHKVLIDEDIDARTYKRTDATLDQASERAQNAVASDTHESLDGHLIARYRDRWDARLRAALKFCLVEPTDQRMFYCNVMKEDPSYIYDLKVDDTVTAYDIQSLGTRMHDLLVRGTLYDWYLHMDITPADSENSLQQLLDDISSIGRGRSYGRKPMQPFGPAYHEYDWDKTPFDDVVEEEVIYE